MLLIIHTCNNITYYIYKIFTEDLSVVHVVEGAQNMEIKTPDANAPESPSKKVRLC